MKCQSTHFLVFCASFYEIAFLKVGDIFCSLALILVWSGSGRGWRPSSCKSCLLFFSTASGPKNNFVKSSLKRPMKVKKKNTTNALINTNVIEILRPRCNFDRQFSEFIHNPYRFCSFDINNYYNQEHIV